MTGAEDVLAVYASGRRLHELMSLTDWRVAQSIFIGSPLSDEAAAARVRYQHVTAPSTGRKRTVTNLLDTWVLRESGHLDDVFAIAPVIVTAGGAGMLDRSPLRISAPRHLSSEQIDRGFERVPLSTADTLAAGLETREDHALARLAYQMACSGLDATNLDVAGVSVSSLPDEVVATYANHYQDFRVVLDDTGTFPLTLWAAGRQVYCAPHFTGCAVDHLVECVRAMGGRSPDMRCDALYVDILLTLRRAVATTT